MSDTPGWRPATEADLDAIMAIQAEVHALQERREVMADKLRLFGEGAWMLEASGRCLGYAIAHPWILGDVPPLDTLCETWPDEADCFFIHDVALMRPARGRGAGRAFVKIVTTLTEGRGWRRMALVSVYDTYPLWERCGFEVQVTTLAPEKLAPYGHAARYMVSRLNGPDRTGGASQS